MKKHLLPFLVLLLASVLVPAVSHAQGVEHLTTKASVGATADHLANGPDGLNEHSRFVDNNVTLEARHCQEYRNGVLIDWAKCAADPTTLFYTHSDHNLRTNAGGDWQASVMANTSAPPATCNYIALSNDATAPSTSDTSVASEITTNGLARAQGTYAHTGGTSSFTVQKVFSATGTQASQKAGLLNASSSGTLCFENTYTQVTVSTVGRHSSVA